MSRADDIVALIDNGLQSSDEHGYGLDNGRCVRCQRREPAESSAWCEPCRTFLLSEEEQPAEQLNSFASYLAGRAALPVPDVTPRNRFEMFAEQFPPGAEWGLLTPRTNREDQSLRFEQAGWARPERLRGFPSTLVIFDDPTPPVFDPPYRTTDNDMVDALAQALTAIVEAGGVIVHRMTELLATAPLHQLVEYGKAMQAEMSPTADRDRPGRPRRVPVCPVHGEEGQCRRCQRDAARRVGRRP